MTKKQTPPATTIATHVSAVDVDDQALIMVPIGNLVEYANNPRVNDHAVKQMADMIRSHGFRVPILVRSIDDGDNYQLVDGHLRLKAARALGMAELPAFLVDDMSDDQVRAFRISVNRAAELAEWDMTRLSAEVRGLNVPAADLPALTGFDDAAIRRLVAEAATPAVAVTPGKGPVQKQADKAEVLQDTDQVSLSLTMTVAQRDHALRTLEELRLRDNLPTKSAAFLRLLAHRAATTQTAAEAAPRKRRKV